MKLSDPTKYDVIASAFAGRPGIDNVVDQMRKRVIELEGGHLVRDQSRGVYGYAR